MKLDPKRLKEEIAGLLPAATYWAHGGFGDECEANEREAELIANWSEKRRLEYMLGRTLVRRTCAQIGIEAGDLLPTAAGGPTWPAGHVGSLSHTHGVALAVLAPRSACAGIGIDVELNERLQKRLLPRVCTPSERAWLARLPQREADITAGIFFSAKESLYKCQHPLTGVFLGFQDVELELDMQSGRFRVRILREGVATTAGAALSRQAFEGRFLLHADLIVTACWLPGEERP